jgi:hypothetical protein
MASPSGVSANAVPALQESAAAGKSSAIAFRRASFEKPALIRTRGPITLGTTEQRVELPIEGSDWAFGVFLDTHAVAAGNSAAVAFGEDGPESVFSDITLRDSNGPIVDGLSGFDLKWANKFGGFRATDDARLGDPRLAQALEGSADADGSFRFGLRVPIALNRRNLLGLLGNADRTIKYYLRTTFAPLNGVYTVAPTAAPVVSVDEIYESFSAPALQNADGTPQAQVPANNGAVSFLTKTTMEAQPSPGTINHYLRRLGLTYRFLMLVFRSNGSRATAEANAPTHIQIKIGNTMIADETYAYRRYLMSERYPNIDSFPDGVLVYDKMTDILGNQAGDELGDDWENTKNVSQYQFVITYPAGFGSTNNELTIITNDLLLPPGVTGASEA